MKKTIIAPVGEFIDELYVGIKEFPTEKVILLSPKDELKRAQDVEEKLKLFQIPTDVINISDNIWEEMFKKIKDIAETEKGELIILVSTGDRDSRCATTSAAFVNGIKAFSISKNGVMMLPVLKFSYYNLISEKKMRILNILYNKDSFSSSLEELSKETGMSIPLLAYHINGNLKAEGLVAMDLIEKEERKGKVNIKLTSQGNMLIKGHT